MTEAATTPTSELALELVVSLSFLETDDLVRLALQKPDLTRVFAAALHTLAVSRATSLLPSSFSSKDGNAAALAIIQVLTRLSERGDPSLTRTFLPTHGSLVDLCVVGHGLASEQIESILDRLVDATAVQDIITCLLVQLDDSASGKNDSLSSADSLRTSANLLLAFLVSCPARALLSLPDLLTFCMKICIDVSPTVTGDVQASVVSLTERDAQTHWFAAKISLMQICVNLIHRFRLLPRDSIVASLKRSDSLMREEMHEPFVRSTILTDMSTTTSWRSISHILSASGLPTESLAALKSVDRSASNTAPFSGNAWHALQDLAGSETQARSNGNSPAAVSDDLVAAVDSVLPHYGTSKLKSILSRDTFRNQEVETIVQRLLDGEEGYSTSPGHDGPTESSSKAFAQVPPETLPTTSGIKARSRLFEDSALGALPVTQMKQRTAKVDELPPELKAAILARAEAGDDESDADEEWNPFAEPQRTVGVEDELDLDFEGRERSSHPNRDGANDNTDDEEDPSRARERALIRHYIQSGSTAFSADPGIRRSADRKTLKEAIGWTDDLIESWGVMFERNPRRDRLLAAATDAELDKPVSLRGEAADDDSDDDEDRPRWGADRGRGGRILSSSRGGNRGSTQRGGSAPKPTRGKGTGNSATDRAAKQKEKQGNKARQRGHDKKMSRVNQ